MSDWHQNRIHLIKIKAQATLEVQTRIAPIWTWEKKTLERWQTDIAALTKVISEEGGKRLEWRMTHEAFHHDLDRLKSFISAFKSHGRIKFGHDVEVLKSLSVLNNRVSKPRKIHAQGLAAQDLWQKNAPDWEISPGMTLAVFSELLATFPGRQQAFEAAQAVWMPLMLELGSKSCALDDDNQAWYKAATERFAAGTTEGDLIRSSLSAENTAQLPKVECAVISNVKVTGNEIQFDCAAAGATHYTYLHQAPGSPLFTVLLADTTETHVTFQTQTPGLHHFKAFGSNAVAIGQESATTPATVTAAAAGQETKPDAAENHP